MPIWSDRVRVVVALIVTLGLVTLVSNRLLVIAPLLVAWALIFRPIAAGEAAVFAVAAIFMLLQNYAALSAGVFEFRFKDVLLQPYYEPVLWGFYFLALKRFVAGRGQTSIRIDYKSVAGVAVTSAMFSLFSGNSDTLFVATTCSTLFLFVLFHAREDFAYACCALVLGFVVELFGVSSGLWWYPMPDFLGIPYWFATMWLSVGLLGRRFAIPAAEWLAARATAQRA